MKTTNIAGKKGRNLKKCDAQFSWLGKLYSVKDTLLQCEGYTVTV